MSIGSIQGPPVPVSTPLEFVDDAEKNVPAGQQGASSLSRITDSASFSSVAPQLQAALEQISTPGASVVETLANNVHQLQEGFVEALYSTLLREGVDLSTKVTLRLDASSALVVTGEHPNKKNIDSLLSKAPELSTAFSEIASQSAALRDIHSLSTMVMRSTGASRYAMAAANPSDAVYQVSIKGEMNHFYFTAKP